MSVTDFQVQVKKSFAPIRSECLFVWFRLCSFSSSFVMHTIFVISITCLLLWQVAMLFNIAFVLDQDSLSICFWILLVVFRSRWVFYKLSRLQGLEMLVNFVCYKWKSNQSKTSVMQMQSYFSSSPPRIIVICRHTPWWSFTICNACIHSRSFWT